MPCTLTGLTQPVCLTIIYNVSSQTLLDSYVDCVKMGETCNLVADFNPTNKNLTIKVPFTLGGEVTFADNLQSACVTTGINITAPTP